MTKDPVATLAAQLDKPTATLIVAEDAETKYFILETALTAAALYLLKRYADKYLEGLGFDAMAKAHGRKTKEFIQKVRCGSATGSDIDEGKQAIATSKSEPPNPAAQADAVAAVEATLIENGGVRAQARTVAAWVSQAAMSECPRADRGVGKAAAMGVRVPRADAAPSVEWHVLGRNDGRGPARRPAARVESHRSRRARTGSRGLHLRR